MRSNNTLMIERLKQSVASNTGCTPQYLRVLRSDLIRLLSQYMSLSDIEFHVAQRENGYCLTIGVSVNSFSDIGKTE